MHRIDWLQTVTYKHLYENSITTSSHASSGFARKSDACCFFDSDVELRLKERGFRAASVLEKEKELEKEACVGLENDWMVIRSAAFVSIVHKHNVQ